MTWDLQLVEKNLQNAFENNSELKLLKVLKDNSFLFYELYTRKWGIQPNFCEVSFGGELRCDFVWLNDNSDGPEWVLVEIEKPKMKIFTKAKEPTAQLNHAIEQVKTWDRYFSINPSEKERIFGAVARFKYILVAGDSESWTKDYAIRWRAHNNLNSKIEIRSTNVFFKALNLIKAKPKEFWSFEDNPVSLKQSQLKQYWETYSYMDNMRKISPI